MVQAIPAVANTQKKTPKTFLQWCQQKKSVPLATRSTINILLDKADTQNCRIANSKLNSLTSLDLYGNQISDIKPLASLTNLTSLDLDANQISDIKPLASLTNLTNLSLIGNQLDRKFCPVKPESICSFN